MRAGHTSSFPSQNENPRYSLNRGFQTWLGSDMLGLAMRHISFLMGRRPGMRTKWRREGRLLSILLLATAIGSQAMEISGASVEPEAGPYTGPTRSDIDATTLDGKVLCGYQGWFNTPCDSESFGFGHWGQGLEGGHGRFVVDMWPDVSDYDSGD